MLCLSSRQSDRDCEIFKCGIQLFLSFFLFSSYAVMFPTIFIWNLYKFLSSSSRHRVKLAYSLWHNDLHFQMYIRCIHTIQSYVCGFIKLLHVHFHHRSSLQSDPKRKIWCDKLGNGESEWQWEKHTQVVSKMSDSRILYTCTPKRTFFHYFMM